VKPKKSPRDSGSEALVAKEDKDGTEYERLSLPELAYRYL